MAARKTRLVPIDKVVVGGRRPVGDLTDLTQSIASIGLLHPVVLTEGMRLVAGLHRLRACQALGWTEIPATIVSLKTLDAEIAELDENLVRTELTVLERAEMLARRKLVHEAVYPQTKRGVPGGLASAAQRRGSRTSDKMSLVREMAEKGRLSKRTVERQIQIATSIPESARALLRGTWAADHQKALLQVSRLPALEQRRVAEQISRGAATVRIARAEAIARSMKRSPRMPTGTYEVIVVDPPWPYDSPTVEYPVMGLDAIKTLPVARLAERHAVVWLWTTNMMIRQAYECLDAWGFDPKTVLTWVKSRPGKEWWLRNQTEHCILAARGKPVVALKSQSTVLQGRSRQAGRKPSEFYALVDGLCPGRKLDMFARESRPGWTTWGLEREKFDRAG